MGRFVFRGAPVLVAVAVAACGGNVATGAGTGGRGGSGGSGASPGSSSGGASSGGAGGSAGAGGSSTGGSGGSGACSGATTQPYPAGPYGYNVGDTLGPGTQSFDGWVDPTAAGYDTTQMTQVALSDFYDPDGKRCTKLLVIDVAAAWCMYCTYEYTDFQNQDYYATYHFKGVQFLGVLFEGMDSSIAQPSDLAVWTKTYDVRFPMVIDPSFWFGHFISKDVAPLDMVIDTSNMQIKDEMLGYDGKGLWQALDAQLAAK